MDALEKYPLSAACLTQFEQSPMQLSAEHVTATVNSQHLSLGSTVIRKHRSLASCTKSEQTKKQDKTTNPHWEGITNITTSHLCKHKKAFPLVSVVRLCLSLGNKLFHAWVQQITMQMYDRAGCHRLTRTNAIWRFCPILLHLESHGQMGEVQWGVSTPTQPFGLLFN